MRRPKLDQLDVRILTTLQADGRITNQRLAEEVGWSPSPCLTRVRKLEGAGLIQRYGAVLDVEALCAPVTVFAELTLESVGQRSQADFESRLLTVPQVVECHEISGGVDYLVRFLCRDIQSYQQVTARLLKDESLGIKQISSRVSLRAVKGFEGVPLAHLLEQ